MGKKWKVFVSEPVDYKGTTHRWLEEQGCEVILGRPIWQYPGWTYTDEELISSCGDIDGVMGASRERYSRRFMESVPKLVVISKYGRGIEKIDIEAATERGILVANTPDTHVDSVAEHAMALILGLAKRLSFAAEYARRGGWRDQNVETIELSGKTIGMIGMGKVGGALVNRLRCWNMRFLAYDPYVLEKDFEEMGVMSVTLEELLKESDIVSLHVVATDETRKMIGEGQLRVMKKSSFLINTARGEVIDEKALMRALQEGWIAGAGLDVTDPEPPQPDNPLFKMDNVIITPHIAGWSSEGVIRFLNKAARNLLKALKGDLPESLVNPEAVPKWRERIQRIERE